MGREHRESALTDLLGLCFAPLAEPLFAHVLPHGVTFRVRVSPLTKPGPRRFDEGSQEGP